MKHGSLESGIGCFDYAAEQMGWENVFSCEINPFGRHILNYYWPNTQHYADVFEFDGTIWRGNVDIITCGFPCQPFSHAGKRKGSADDRHIWPENMRIIREAQPAFVLAENVPGLLTIENGMVFENVCADLEAEGYTVTPLVIPACATDKDHRRDRVWIVAYSERFQSKQRHQSTMFRRRQDEAKQIRVGNCGGVATDTNGTSAKHKVSTGRHLPAGILATSANTLNPGLQRHEQRPASEQGTWTSRPAAKRFKNENWLEVATRLCSVDDGTAGRLDTEAISKSKWRTESLKGYGNAIIWEIAYNIFNAIQLSLNPAQ